MRIKNMKALVAVFLVLVSTISVSILVIPTVKAIPTFATVIASPNPVLVGQAVTLVMDISPDPPDGESFYGITFSITSLNASIPESHKGHAVSLTHRGRHRIGRFFDSFKIGCLGHFSLLYSIC